MSFRSGGLFESGGLLFQVNSRVGAYFIQGISEQIKNVNDGSHISSKSPISVIDFYDK